MIDLKIFLGILGLGIAMPISLQAQDFALSTSVPSLLVGNINIEPSIPLSSRLSLQLGLSARPKSFGLPMPTGMIHWLYNGRSAGFSDKMSWSTVQRVEHVSFSPSLRLWRKGVYNRGVFFGLHALGMLYRFGSDDIQTSYSEGFLVGAGATIGYSYELAPRWNLEAEGGITAAYTRYDLRYASGTVQTEDKSRVLVLPARLALRLVYLF